MLNSHPQPLWFSPDYSVGMPLLPSDMAMWETRHVYPTIPTLLGFEEL